MADDRTARRTVLIICGASPYGSARAREALDTALAFGAFEQPVSLLFSGDGVLGLLPAQRGETDGGGNLQRLFGTLPDYGIERVWADAVALAERGIDPAQLPPNAGPVAAAGIRALIEEHDIVLSL